MMARLDGWLLAECEITNDGSELVICEPASEGDPANSITIGTLDAILQLRDLIQDAITRYEHQRELELQSNDGAGLTTG
jgi:hypothetical protein